MKNSHPYYPFGLRHQAYTTQARSLVIDEDVKIGKPGTDPIIITQVPKEEVRYKYKYNGKELQEEHSLNWHDYGARNYDATLGRFMSLDPLTEKINTQSPYVYADNKPVRFRDIMGMAIDSTFNMDKMGRIIPVDDKKYYDENGKEMDKLVAETSGEEMLVDKGVLGNTKYYENKKKNSKKSKQKTESNYAEIIETTNTGKKTALFEFMSKNVADNIEIAFAQFDNNKSYVYTTFTSGRVLAFATNYLLNTNHSAKMRVHFHSHPYGGDPSRGDSKNVLDKHKLGHPTLFYIYNIRQKQYFYYDEKGIILSGVNIKLNK